MTKAELMESDLNKIFDFDEIADDKVYGDFDIRVNFFHELFRVKYPDAKLNSLTIDSDGNFNAHLNFMIKIRFDNMTANTFHNIRGTRTKKYDVTVRSIFLTLNAKGKY